MQRGWVDKSRKIEYFEVKKKKKRKMTRLDKRTENYLICIFNVLFV